MERNRTIGCPPRYIEGMPFLPRLGALDALLLDLDDTILDDRSGIEGAWAEVVSLVCARRPELPATGVAAAIESVTAWFWSDPERERRGRLDLVAARRAIVMQSW